MPNPSWVRRESPRLPSLSVSQPSSKFRLLPGHVLSACCNHRSTSKVHGSNPDQGIPGKPGSQTVDVSTIGIRLAPLGKGAPIKRKPTSSTSGCRRADCHHISSAQAIQYPLQGPPLQPRRKGTMHAATTAQQKQDGLHNEARPNRSWSSWQRRQTRSVWELFASRLRCCPRVVG
jgi:hypothetical protein